MIEVTPKIRLSESELVWRFVRGSGPGGQNVNKVATTVQLRWDAMGSPALTNPVKLRLARLAGQRLTDKGEILIEAGEHRSQQRNRREALDRLLRLIRRAAAPPKPRRPTRPSQAAKARRVDRKRRHAAKKHHRRFDPQRDWA
jgi:ribosome-associated protein